MAEPVEDRSAASPPPSPAAPAEAAPAADLETPPLPEGAVAVRTTSPSALVALLKSRKELRALTMQTAGAKFAGLVPAFDEKMHDDDRWEFEGNNASGLVRSITLAFTLSSTASGDDTWVFHSVSVRLHSDDPSRTFQEVRRAANASLKRPRWLDLNARDRTAWSLGDGWELVAAVLDDGEIHLRAGRPPGP